MLFQSYGTLFHEELSLVNMLLFNLHLTIDDQYYSNFPKLLGNVFLGSVYMSSLTIFPLEILEFCLD